MKVARAFQAVLSGARPSGDFPMRSLGRFEGAHVSSPCLPKMLRTLVSSDVQFSKQIL